MSVTPARSSSVHDPVKATAEFPSVEISSEHEFTVAGRMGIGCAEDADRLLEQVLDGFLGPNLERLDDAVVEDLYGELEMDAAGLPEHIRCTRCPERAISNASVCSMIA